MDDGWMMWHVRSAASFQRHLSALTDPQTLSREKVLVDPKGLFLQDFPLRGILMEKEAGGARLEEETGLLRRRAVLSEERARSCLHMSGGLRPFSPSAPPPPPCHMSMITETSEEKKG